MAARTRLQQAADRRSRELRRGLGTDLRLAREDQGIRLRRLATAAGIDPAHLSRIEAGTAHPSVEVLERVATCLGGEVGLRFFPSAGSPLRDRIQAAIVEQLVRQLAPVWSSSVEVPVHRPARGVIDVVLAHRHEPVVVAVEVHSQIRRLEQLLRWTNLKRESLPSADLWAYLTAGQPTPDLSSLLVLRVTAATRAVAIDHAATLSAAYPGLTSEAVASLLRGTPWPGSSIVWADVTSESAALREQPPRGLEVGRVRPGDRR